jgi:hypothetical protein
MGDLTRHDGGEKNAPMSGGQKIGLSRDRYPLTCKKLGLASRARPLVTCNSACDRRRRASFSHQSRWRASVAGGVSFLPSSAEFTHEFC